MNGDFIKICNNTLAPKVSKFYRDNRYASYIECTNPCKTMTVTTINKFKSQEKGKLFVEIYLPRKIAVTRQVFVKSFITFGRYLCSNSLISIEFIFSC